MPYERLWEMPWKAMRNTLFCGQNAGNTMRNTLLCFILIVLYNWFEDCYHIYYENMRNENEKSFAGALI